MPRPRKSRNGRGDRRTRNFVQRLGFLTFFLAIGHPFLSAAGARTGLCFSFSAHSADYRGDFRDARVLWHFEKAFEFPRLARGYGLAVSLGAKMDKGSWDISYLLSMPAAVLYGGASAAIVLHALEVNGRSYLLPRSAVHPYFLGGICLPVLSVSRGAQYQGRSHDATYLGGGLNVGAGLSIDLGPSMVLNAGAAGRFLWFLYAFGGGKGRDINHLTDGTAGPRLDRLLRTTSLVLSVGLGFIL